MKACPFCLSTFDDTVRFCPFHGAELKQLSEHEYQQGDSICGYYLKQYIGNDGLGDVYCATRAGNSYRFRLYSPAILCDPERVSSLLSILEKTCQISGGGIPIADYDWLDDGLLYSAHPYIPGCSFQNILDMNIELSESEVAELLFQLLRAVKDIHAQRIVNGNIALSNIILDKGGRIRLHDACLWGILRGEHFDEIRDDHPEVLASIIDLMSPELARGDDPKTQSDVYSCGAAACCLLTGEAGHGTIVQRVHSHVIGDIQDIRIQNPHIRVSDDFGDLLMASMIGTSGVRFQTARAFITALLSIHPELDENVDSISPALAERLLNDDVNSKVYTKKSTSPYAILPLDVKEPREETSADTNTENDTSFSTEPAEEESSYTSPCSDISSWNDLADLIGNQSDQKEILPFADASSDIEHPLFSHPDLTPCTDLLANVFSGICEANLQTSSTDADLNPREEKSETQEQTENTQEKEEPVKEEAQHQESSSETAGTSQESAEDATTESQKKESEAKASSSETTKDESAPKKAEDDPASSKPHKRIGRKKPENSSELENGDIISISTSKDIRRIKRTRRASFEPQNEVVLSDVVIKPLVNQDSDAIPSYCKLPYMTVSAGYKPFSTSDKKEETSKPAPVVNHDEEPDNSNDTENDLEQENEEWFVNETRAKKASILNKLIAIAAVLALICLALFIYSLNTSENPAAESPVASQVPAYQPAPSANTDKNSTLDDFHAALGTSEFETKAIELFNELRNSDIDQKTIQQCREELVKALNSQAITLRQTLKKSDEQPNPLDISDISNELTAAYVTCTTSVDAAAPDSETQLQQCADAKDKGLIAAQSKALANAEALRPDFEKQLKGWTDLEKLYATIVKMQRNQQVPDAVLNQTDSHQQISDYEQRLKSIDEEKTRVASAGNTGATEGIAVPAAPESDPALLAMNQPTDTANSEIEPEDTNTQSETVTPEPAPAQPVAQPVSAQQAAEPAPAQPVPAQQAAEPAPVQPVPAQQAAEPAPVQPVAQPKQEQKKQEQPATQPKQEQTAAQPKQEQPATQPKQEQPATQPKQEQPATQPKQEQKKQEQTAAQPKQEQKKQEQTAAAQPSEQPKPAQTAKPAASGSVPTGQLLQQASQAMAKKDFASAISLCEQATKQDSKNARAWQMLTQAYEKQGKTAVAANAAEKWCFLANTASCYVYLGNLKSKSGDAAEAKKAFEKALALDPNNAQAKAKVSNL